MPQWRINAPLAAVLHDGQVIACTPETHQAGVRHGMNAQTAAAITAGIQFVQHQPQRTRKHLEAIATTLLQYTPEVALFNSDSLLLDVSASLSLFKGPRNLYKRIQTSLYHLNVQARVSMAPTAAGAWLISLQTQTRQRRMLRIKTTRSHLNALHINNLPMARPYLDWLTALGCTTLQDLARLPRSGLNQRTSPQISKYLDAAYGKTSLDLSWYHPPDTFHASCQLDFHTTHAQTLMNAARGLIEQLCGWLHARHHMATRLQFSLHHEKGRHACLPTCIVLQFSAPSRHTKDFLLMLQEHLQHERLQAPVIELVLHHIESQQQDEPSGELFPDRAHYHQQENQLLDILRARLGQNNILQPKPLASHLPEYANQWGIADRCTAKGHHTVSEQFGETRFPFWMLENPIKLETHNHRPRYQGYTLHLVQGPERIESGWWMNGKHEQRDYFVAQDHQQCLYWIYRQRDAIDLHWYLQGLFA